MILLHFRYTYAISSCHKFPLCCGHLEPKYQPISQPEIPHVITSFQSSRLTIHALTLILWEKQFEMWFIVVCTLTNNEYVSLFVSQTFFRIVSAY